MNNFSKLNIYNSYIKNFSYDNEKENYSPNPFRLVRDKGDIITISECLTGEDEGGSRYKLIIVSDETKDEATKAGRYKDNILYLDQIQRELDTIFHDKIEVGIKRCVPGLYIMDNENPSRSDYHQLYKVDEEYARKESDTGKDLLDEDKHNGAVNTRALYELAKRSPSLSDDGLHYFVRSLSDFYAVELKEPWNIRIPKDYYDKIMHENQ